MTGIVGTSGTAQVVADYGRRHLVRFDDSGQTCEAVSRGKRTEACVGDRIVATITAPDQAVIERILPRRTFLQRSDRYRVKGIAANVDRAAVVIAGEPRYSEALLLRQLVAIEAAGIAALVIAGKSDLAAAHPWIGARLDVLRELGIAVVELAAGPDPAAAARALRGWLANSTTVLIGESGMGKSTLINALAPHAGQATREISAALGAGRHTTTASRLFELDPEIAPAARLIDSPGFQTFGLAHLSASQRIHAMPDLAPFVGRCRFHSCTHRHEPGCAIRAAAEAGTIDALRYRLFLELHERD